MDRRRARRLGTGVATIVAAAALAFLVVQRAGVLERKCLLLVTVEDGSKLVKGSPVFYRGLQAGSVVGVRPPSGDVPGWRVRMAVDRSAFVHIATDARVRLQSGGKDKPMVAVVLPGFSPPDSDYPLDAKVLREVTTEEEAVRVFQDVLEGLSELSRAKRSEAEVIELRDEVERLRRRLAELEAERKPAPP